MPTRLIRHLEEMAANAWPAAVVQIVDGWRLRFNGGVTRRANSVWPNEASGRFPLEEKLALVEDFYARWGGPARYQICPAAQPENLDTILAQRGYITDALTAVQSAPLATILAHTESHVAATVSVADGFDEGWFATYCRAERVDTQAAEARRAILQRIGPRTGYALLQVDGQPAAIGLAVAEQGWSGLFNMVTRPEFRRQGAATAILHALARWSERHQVTTMYLQVMENNGAALALYERVGFETLYHYHYREAPRDFGRGQR
jgi:ribosomal protein S18 acetylase RimI-like enzyme